MTSLTSFLFHFIFELPSIFMVTINIVNIELINAAENFLLNISSVSNFCNEFILYSILLNIMALNVNYKAHAHCKFNRFSWNIVLKVITARKVSKYGVFSGPCYPVSVFSDRIQENTDQKKFRIWTRFTQWIRSLFEYSPLENKKE